MFTIVCVAAGAQINGDAYQWSNLDEVMAAYRLQVAPDDLASAEANLIKPEIAKSARRRPAQPRFCIR